MKTLIQITFFSIFLVSCADDEISYPATYVFDSDQEVDSSIVTKEPSGAIVEVDAVQSLNAPLCDFFLSIQEGAGITSLTLLSESEIEISINSGNGVIQTMTTPYKLEGNVILEELGLEFDENDNVISKICNTFTFAPSENAVFAESNYCYINNNIDANDRVVVDFIGEQYQSGDTLGLCIINKIYKRQ